MTQGLEEARARDAERLLGSLLMRATEPAYVTDSEGVFKYVVASNESALGYSPDELTGTSAFELVHPEDLILARRAYADVLADPLARPTVVYRARAKDGSWRWRESRLSNQLDDPLLGGIVCDVSDVTEQQELLRQLRAADARQRAIVTWSRDTTLFIDPDGTIRWASPVSAELLGIEPDVLVGQNGLDFVHPDDRERVFAEFLKLTGLGDHVRTEFRVTDPRGELRWVEEDATNLIENPDVGYVVANLRDITERKNAEEQLERLLLHDPLTGLPNRALLVNRLEQLLTRESPTAILYIDVDNFTDVNDSLGHAAGDELLRLIAERFAGAIVRSPWTLARVGSDHFVVLCEDVHEATTAFSYAEQLRESLRAPFELQNQEVVVTVSIGVALSPGDATELLRDAGMARHQAKLQGRDRVIVFARGLDSTQQQRLVVQGQLRRALANDELVAWYQPMIDLRTRRVGGVEALVRWNHPERGLLDPEQFLDVAESSGLVAALGNQVLRHACAAARMWQQRGCALHISVNAAAAQLCSGDYVDEIESALREFELEPGRLTIELTETAAMQVADSLENLHRIRSLGVHLSLDDFGTGYSSLSFLRELPVDAIKIDRAFVTGLGTNARDASIVEGVVAIGAALGYAVVAEGVETAVQADTLRGIGCRYAQGFLWSRPVPAADIGDLVQRIERAGRSGEW